jgi:hypothetical protein
MAAGRDYKMRVPFNRLFAFTGLAPTLSEAGGRGAHGDSMRWGEAPFSERPLRAAQGPTRGLQSSRAHPPAKMGNLTSSVGPSGCLYLLH